MKSSDQLLALWTALGKYIHQEIKDGQMLETHLRKAHSQNPWFTLENSLHMLRALADSLEENKVAQWLKNYTIPVDQPKSIGLIMAGNLPLVGFHDILCVLSSGHRLQVKMSSQDQVLPALLRDWILELAPDWKDRFVFTEKLNQAEGLIATGSDNSSRYFEYYFSKIPHIIRKNRNSVAVLTGHESEGTMQLLGEDIFRYFGLGCRNVSKIYVPKGYDFAKLYQPLEGWKQTLSDHNKYMNNYIYNRSVYLLKSIPFLDNNFLMLVPEESLASPIAILYYEEYDELKDVQQKLELQKDQIQCIVGDTNYFPQAVGFGQTQCPQLTDYADRVDTMSFLLNQCR